MDKSIFRLTVRGYELDSFGHVNNAVYLQYAEEAKWHFFSETKLLGLMNERGLFPVILENKLRYMHELKMHDEVRIETSWSTKGKTLHFTQTIFNETENVKSCVVKGTVAFVDHERIMHDIPEELFKLEILQK
ncbi:thioesterase family protein [Ruminococcus sp. HUN007]|uniref:acyl-CoA thioesterase n=1 Tax=Ruminococcus sp. HUN007 TaxID=1514668 RepID=UPI0005D21F5A|nr:thioesterase family protein [Ruminococcus sp. HUN007]